MYQNLIFLFLDTWILIIKFWTPTYYYLPPPLPTTNHLYLYLPLPTPHPYLPLNNFFKANEHMSLRPNLYLVAKYQMSSGPHGPIFIFVLPLFTIIVFLVPWFFVLVVPWSLVILLGISFVSTRLAITLMVVPPNFVDFSIIRVV